MSKSSIAALLLVAAAATVAYAIYKGTRRPASAAAPAGTSEAVTPASLLAGLYGQQVTLASGHILDTETGVIYDPATSSYVNMYTGELIYRGA